MANHLILATFREYQENSSQKSAPFDNSTVHINPSEVAVIREWKYHSFRSPITEIVLKSGCLVRVWQTEDEVIKKLTETKVDKQMMIELLGRWRAASNVMSESEGDGPVRSSLRRCAKELEDLLELKDT